VSDVFEPVDLAVVGGGISGLACAFWAKSLGRSVILFESSGKVGGCITSVRAGAYIADGGPQSFLPSEPIAQLVKDAGLDALVLPALESAARPYLYFHRRLVAVPQSPQQMILTPLLSPLAKLRALGEPLVGRSDASDESVADFVRRRAGAAVLQNLVGPYVSGIFAGDPNQLSLRSAFPMMAEMEREYGSIIKGALARMRQQRANAAVANVAAANVAADLQVRSGDQSPGRARRRSFGFRGGNDVLPRALAQHMGTDVRLNAPVKALWQRGEWMELLVGGNMDSRVVAKNVVVATPAGAAAELLDALEPHASAALRSFEYPTVVQIAFAYPRTAIGVPLDGFGFLVPRTEGLRILGCVWNSAMFADRCPENEVLVTAFLGGATDSLVAEQSDEELARQAHEELRGVMRISDVAPHIVAGFRWQEAIPQYNVGHAQKIGVIRDCLARLPGVRLCGSYLKGPSVTDCIATSRTALS